MRGRSSASGGEARSQRNDGYGADSGPSRGHPCTRTLRPTTTFTAANVMSGFVDSRHRLDVSIAQIPLKKWLLDCERRSAVIH